MKSFLKRIAVLAVPVLAILFMGYSNVNKSESTFKTFTFTLASGVAQRLNPPATLAAEGIDTYNQFCIKVRASGTTEEIFLTDYSPTLPGDEATTGWPLVGTEKSCFDWGHGVPIYGWCNTAGTGCPKEIRVMFSR